MAPPAGAADDKSLGAAFNRLPGPQKVAILLVVVVVLGLAYYFAVYMGLSGEIEQADQQFTTLQGELRTAQERQAQYISQREELLRRGPIDRENLRVLPERGEIATFLQDLNRLAELSGLRIQLVEPQAEAVEEFIVRMPVQLEVRGRYLHVVKFFWQVSRLDRAISMENIEMKEPEFEGEDTVVIVRVLATTFRRAPQEEPIPSTPQGAPGAPPPAG
ncbi:MAG: type 4a pilus biogenesis protein PilO [Deltaproteobacteria bacterium]|nr:type 4a pilus biogenesis protein PilO [Deltaproteobacteria bacterium]